MRKNTPVLVSVLLLTITILFGATLISLRSDLEQSHLPYLEKTKNSKKLSKYDRIDLAMELELEKTMDPALGYVPRERLLQAQETAEQIRSSRAALTNVNWTERGPNNVGGRTRAIMIDPNDPTGKTVWAGGVAGGLWKTTDIYASDYQWTAINDQFDNLAVTAIAADPSNTNNMYFGTGEGWFNADAVRGMGIWKSADAGNTWTHLSSTNNSTFTFIQDLAVTSTGDILAATKAGGVRRSQDGGATWTKVLGAGAGYYGVSNSAADIEIAANGDIYVSLGLLWSADGIYKSTDGGTTWTKLAGGLPTSGYYRIALATAPSDANRVYAVYQSSSTNNTLGIYKSTDAGASWSAVTNPGAYGMSNFTRGQAWYNLTIAVDHNNPDRIFIGGIDILRSTNGGSTWTQLTQWYGGGGYPYIHADQHAIIFKPGSSDTIFFGNDGGIFMTLNGSAGSPAFSNRINNYNVTQFYACAAHPDAGSNYFLAGAQDNGSHKFTSYGVNATAEVTGGDGAFVHIDQDNPNYQFTSYVYNNYRRSSDGGNTFVNGPGDNSGRFINPTDYDDVNNKMYAAYGADNYMRWDNATTSFTYNIVTVTAFNGRQVSAVTVSPNTANTVFFATDQGRVIKVEDAHTSSPTVTHINSGAGMPNSYINCIEVQRGDDDHILVTYTNYGTNSIWETKNGGTTWTSVEGNLPDMPVRWALFNPNDSSEALIATEVGVWSTDELNGAGTVWGPSNSGLANVRVDMLQLRSSDNMVVAATHGRGLFTSDIFADENADFYTLDKLTYQGNSVQFYDASSQATSWLWDFGDGNTSTQQNPSHIYNTSGKFTVTLTINGSASKTKTSYVQILPNKYVPYMVTDGGNFEANPNDFGSIDLYGGVNIWEKGAPGNFLTTLNTTTNGWKTDLDADIQRADYESALYTPNFNFVTPGTYTISFRLSMEVIYCNAPFTVQVHYSTDKGESWARLGNSVNADPKGSNWYNSGPSEGCAISASIVEDQIGWAGTFNNMLASYDVSSLAGNANVAFRFVIYTESGWSGGYNADGFMVDDFEVNGPPLVLPVTMQEFEAKAIEDHAQLHWITANEKNNAGFEIFRSRDGINFENIGFVKGNGTTSSVSEYFFKDEDVEKGKYYYRLRQVDFNGFGTNSEVKMVEFRDKGIAVNLYPNPAKNDFYISIKDIQKERLNIHVLDISGKQIFAQSEIVAEEFYKQNINCSSWPAGVYFVKISGIEEKTIKMVKY